MLTPDYLENCTDRIVALYRELESTIIEDMARRIGRMGGVTDATLWQLEAAQQSGAMFDDIIQEIARINGEIEDEVRRLFKEAGGKALAFDDAAYKAMGLTPLPLPQSESMLQVLLAAVQKTLGNLDNLTMTTAATGQTAFIEAMNLAHMQVASGGMSYTEAIRRAVRKLSDEGVTSVTYGRDGRERHHRLDVASRRATLTGVNQTAAELGLMRMDELGADLLEVTAHIGAREEHAVWQGQIYSRSGRSHEYPDFVYSTDYGEGHGLCGWNCRHSFFPYFEGYSYPGYDREALDRLAGATLRYNDEDIPFYDATQIQRKFERDIRNYKRELAAFSAAMGGTTDPALIAELKAAFAESSVSLKGEESALKGFLRQTGLPRQAEREQIYGFGRSEAQRAVWANRKAAS